MSASDAVQAAIAEVRALREHDEAMRRKEREAATVGRYSSVFVEFVVAQVVEKYFQDLPAQDAQNIAALVRAVLEDSVT